MFTAKQIYLIYVIYDYEGEGCLVEHGYKYNKGGSGRQGYNLNGISADVNKTSDYVGCRSFCSQKYPAARYFTFRLNKSKQCWCLWSNAGRLPGLPGDTSGIIRCNENGKIFLIIPNLLKNKFLP